MLSPGTRGGVFWRWAPAGPQTRTNIETGGPGGSAKTYFSFLGGCSKRDGDGDAGDGGVMAMVIMLITTMTNMPDHSHPRRHTHAHTHTRTHTRLTASTPHIPRGVS